MLTKNDFDQIREIIREEVENEAQSIKSELSSKVILSRMRVQQDIEDLKNRIKNLEIGIARTNNKDSEFLDEEIL